jgi:hypothetical protein
MLADRAEVADTSAKRRTGSAEAHGLAPGEGLWIVPCEGVHTFRDEVHHRRAVPNSKHKILKIRPNMVRRRIAVSLLAHSVLELPAGTLAETGRARDQLELEKIRLTVLTSREAAGAGCGRHCAAWWRVAIDGIERNAPMLAVGIDDLEFLSLDHHGCGRV